MKYSFTGRTRDHLGRTLHQIRHNLTDEIGGWIEHPHNLSQGGGCWVSRDVMVWGEAQVSGNARVYDEARIFDRALVYNNAEISGHAQIFGNSEVFNYARVTGNAKVWGYSEVQGFAIVRDEVNMYGRAVVKDAASISGTVELFNTAMVGGNTQLHHDVIVTQKNISIDRSDHHTFSICNSPSGQKIVAGCRYFSYEEALIHWSTTRANTPLGEESLYIVNALKNLARIRNL